MTLEILAGSLSPVLHDGTAQDAVYGVDAQGKYLGIVPAAQAAQTAASPPPALGEWRFVGGMWRVFESVEYRSLVIDQQRDTTINAGAMWSGRLWYADAGFEQRLAAYIQAFSEGLLSPTATVGIRAKDKVVYDMGRDDLRQLAGAVMLCVQQAFTASWEAKAAISG